MIVDPTGQPVLVIIAGVAVDVLPTVIPTLTVNVNAFATVGLLANVNKFTLFVLDDMTKLAAAKPPFLVKKELRAPNIMRMPEQHCRTS